MFPIAHIRHKVFAQVYFNIAFLRGPHRFASVHSSVEECYSLLGLCEECSNVELKDKFIQLAKMFHPDSGKKTADQQKFILGCLLLAHLHYAQTSRQELATKSNCEEQVEQDIEHIAPQHRQYLSFEGIGFGVPSQRQKQYDIFKAERASESMFEHQKRKSVSKYETSLVVKDKTRSRRIKTTNLMDRLVEDLIAESIARGDFTNLPGMGKPLQYENHNPMVDTTTHNLNKILIQNGYAPEWVTLEKEIRKEISTQRNKLLDKRLALGIEKLSPTKEEIWNDHVRAFEEALLLLNQKVQRLNLLTPIMRFQLLPYQLKREVERAEERFDELVRTGEALQLLMAVKSRDSYSYSSTEPALSPAAVFTDMLKEMKSWFTVKNLNKCG